MTYATSSNKTTDPSLGSYGRGVQAGLADVSCDWNEETGEYNPFPKSTPEFQLYEQGYDEAYEQLVESFPHI